MPLPHRIRRTAKIGVLDRRRRECPCSRRADAPLWGQPDWAEFVVAVALPAQLRLVLVGECRGVRGWG